MTKKKKNRFLLISLIIILSTLACHIPLVSQNVTPQENPNSTAILETTPTKTAEPEVSVVTSTPRVVGQEDPEKRQVYSQNGIEITLPGTFVLGDFEKNLEALPNDPDFLNEENSETFEEIYNDYKEDILLWAYEINPAGHQETSLLVMKNDQFGGMPLTLISTFAESFIGTGVDFVDRDQLSLDDRDVLRLITSTANSGEQSSQVIYLFNQGGSLWIIGFYTKAEQVQDHLTVFNDIVASIRILENE